MSRPLARGIHPKQCRPQRSVGIAVLLHRGQRIRRPHLGFLEPGLVMPVQRVSIRISNQRRAIINLSREFVAGTERLILSGDREPAPEGILVLRQIKAKKIRRTISKTVGWLIPGTGSSFSQADYRE